MDDRLNAAEAELSAMLRTVLEGPLGPLRAEVAALQPNIEASVKKIAGGIHVMVDNQTTKILKQLGNAEDETDGRSDNLAAEQAGFAKTLARLEKQAATLAAEQTQITPALEAAVARLDEHAARLQELLAALQTDTASRLQGTVQRLEASLDRSMVSQTDRLAAGLASQLAALMRLGMICAAGIVLTLAAVLFPTFWH